MLTWINILGLRRGAVLQNVATWMKCAAIAAFVVLGITIGHGDWSHFRAASTLPIAGSAFSAMGVALIAVFWAFDGWVFVSFVAGEIREPQRNLPRALILGIIIVAVIYLMINVSYLYALPMSALAVQQTVAQAAAVTLFSPAAARWLAAMIAVSCFGAMSTCILSDARVFYAMAHDGLFFHRLARIHPRWHTPVFSLVLQGIWAVVLAVSGRYDQLFTYTMFWMVIGYAGSVAGLFALRRKHPHAPRPYRCTGYPWLPAIYVLFGGAWALNAAWQRPKEAAVGTAIVLLGVPGYLYWRRERRT